MSNIDTDPYENLPSTIAIGSDIYDLKPNSKFVNLSHKDRNDFLKTFQSYNNLDRVEELLRKYLFVAQKYDSISFRPSTDKKELLTILTKRRDQLKESLSSSNTLKHISNQRYYLDIQNIIYAIENPESEKKQIEIPSLTDNEIFRIILEISWYLQHPDDVPDKIATQWSDLLKEFKTMRLIDIIDNIKELHKTNSSIQVKNNPLNYFEKIDVKQVINQKNVSSAKKKTIEMIVAPPPPPPASAPESTLTSRITKLLEILRLKEYIDDSQVKNSSFLNNSSKIKQFTERVFRDPIPIQPSAAVSQLVSSILPNTTTAPAPAKRKRPVPQPQPQPKKGGALETIALKSSNDVDEKEELNSRSPLTLLFKQAILPLFDDFKNVYDPVYTFIENIIKKITTQAIDLRSLLVLLHICTQLRECNSLKSNDCKYGVYRIKNAPKELIAFIITFLNETELYLNGIQPDAQEAFKRNLQALPKVRVSAFIKKNGTSVLPTDTKEIPCLNFVIIGKNAKIPESDKLSEYQKKVDSKFYTELLPGIFKQDDLYLILNTNVKILEQNAIRELREIPMNLQEIDYLTVDIKEKQLKINSLSKTFDDFVKEKGLTDLYFDNLLTMNNNLLMNDAELGLSTFITLKDSLTQ